MNTLPAMHSAKVLPFEKAAAHFETLRLQGRRIVQSHGIFDLIHPGHICHLEEARSLGDALVVTLTVDGHVQKGPGRPYFNEQLRQRSVAALACVDFVVLVPFPGAVEAIDAVRPNIYCRGLEYEDPEFDPTGAVLLERAAVELVGGEMRYIGSVKYSATRLLNQFFDHLSEPVRNFCTSLATNHTRRQVHDAVDGLRSLRVLVVGDTIFDRYSSLHVQGLTSKNRIISGRFLGEETHCGGALAVVRHVQQFTEQVRFVSLTGTEPWALEEFRRHLAPGQDCAVRDPAFTTILKQRFVEPLTEGKEMSKLFSVNYLDNSPPSAQALEQVQMRLREWMPWADAVLLLDFGHGLLQPGLRDLLQAGARFLAINCQTNSNNHGFNIVNRRYRRADAFTLDEQELMLAAGERSPNFTVELERLRTALGARYAWLTRGAVETIGLLDGHESCTCPPLERDVVDTVGAGDAFFAVAALAAARGLPLPLATFMGQLAGAQAVRVVGNARPISRATLLQSGMSLLNL